MDFYEVAYGGLFLKFVDIFQFWEIKTCTHSLLIRAQNDCNNSFRQKMYLVPRNIFPYTCIAQI